MPKSSRFAIAALALMTMLTTGSVSAVAGTGSPASGPSTSERVIEAAGNQWNRSPGDYAALADSITSAGGDSVRFSFPEAGLDDLTGAEAQRLVTQARRTGHADVPVAGKITAIPATAFNVSGSWYHVQAQDGEWWNYNGNWDFQNTYLAGQAPDDAAGIATAGMPSACFRLDGDTFFSARVSGLNTSAAGYRKQVDFDSVVYGVQDRNVSHVMNVDHGTLTMSYRRRTSGCSLAQTRGKFFFEHNTGGNASWNASITIGVLNLSYSGAVGARLQKSSTLDYLS